MNQDQCQHRLQAAENQSNVIDDNNLSSFAKYSTGTNSGFPILISRESSLSIVMKAITTTGCQYEYDPGIQPVLTCHLV
jgi:hypothetical protein